MSEFVMYWATGTVAAQLEVGGVLDHAASEQLGRVKPRDTLWIVTYFEATLYLVGYVEIGKAVSRSDAEAIFGTTAIWPAEYHVIAQPGTEVPPDLVDITALAPELRFDGKPDQLPDNFSNHNFRTMRKLKGDSGDLLREAWETAETVD